MQKNRTTYPTGGQAVADDGVLAGRELESDTELIALGWLKPTDLFEGDELPAIFPEDDAQERAERLAERRAEREACQGRRENMPLGRSKTVPPGWCLTAPAWTVGWGPPP